MSGLMVGRRVLLTGAMSGIGTAIVQRLADEGATGVVLDLPVTLDRSALPTGFTAIGVDVRDEILVADAVTTAQAGAPPLDALVTCAGIVAPWSTFAQLDMVAFDDVLAVNTRGVALTLKHATPHMRDGGAVAMVGSLNSWRGHPDQAAYVASKHAVHGLARAAALDLGRRGIRVNTVAPGPIATEALLSRMRRRSQATGRSPDDELAQAAAATALGRIATAEDIAAAVLFLVCDLSAAISGQLLPVDGGIA